MILLDLIRWLLSSLAALALAACGGGGGGGGGQGGAGNAAPPAAAPPLRNDVLFGYYGTGDGQLAATADHASIVWIGPWDPARSIGDLQEAHARGLRHAIVDLSYLLFSDRHYVGSARAKAAVRGYLASLGGLGLLPLLTAVYTIDEPELNLDEPSEVVQANADLRAVFAEFAIAPALAVIYTDHRSFPGRESYDWLGCDQYGRGPCEVPLSSGQKLVLVAGGADPWREDPAPYLERTAADPSVALLVGFTWFDRGGDRGIGHNGMASAYRGAGVRLKGTQ